MKTILQTNRILAIALFSSILLISCTKEVAKEKSTEKIPFSGTYNWSFEIPMLGSQKSTHTFYQDSIRYVMKGAVHSTNYVQELVSYDSDEKRCITIGKGGVPSKTGVYFVMFFKDITDSTLTIYKHECKTLNEAETFAYPAADATADYGWNTYHKE